MFLCCGEQSQNIRKGDHVLQMFEPEKPLQKIPKGKDLALKAFIPVKPRRASIFNISNNQGQGKMSNVFNIMQNNNEQFQNFIFKKVMKSNYQQLIDEYSRTNKSWVDPDFPPEQRSFGLQRATEKVKWKRIGEIIKNPVFIRNKIDPSDILQGKIGDCYFLSAICGLAEKQERITSLFQSLQINNNGIYMARILIKGVLKEIVVDDYFPVSKIDGRLVCSNPAGGNQIWVMILQKCWAKLFGSYEAIDGGLPNEVLHAFSGAPIYQYITNQLTPEETDDLFNKMYQSDKRDHVICCGTYGDGESQEVGLVLGHAYSVISVFDSPQRLLKIRNPWGEKQWNGRASEYDKAFWNRLSSYDKKKLGHVQQNDGTFFMPWDDFLVHFLIVDICKVEKKANYYYQELVFPRGQGVFNELVIRGGEATIALSQYNTRGIKTPEPRYATSTIIIAKKVKRQRNVQDYEYISCFSSRNTRDVNHELTGLQQGSYIIYSTLNGRNNVQQATLSCYAENPVHFLPLQITEQEFLHRIYLNHARKNVENHQKIFGNQDVWVCMDILYDSGFAYTAVHIGAGVQLKLGLTFNQQQYIDNNFQLMAPFKGKGIFKMVCVSGEDSIIVCRIIPQNFAFQASMPIPNIKRLS